MKLGEDISILGISFVALLRFQMQIALNYEQAEACDNTGKKSLQF